MSTMPRLYFLAAAIFALVGMAWGIHMSATQDHSLAPAHGHLNLIGFVVMAVFGTYYALAPKAAAGRLCAVHFAVTLLAVVTMVPGIALAVTGNGETLAKIGSILAVGSMAIFVFVVARSDSVTSDAVAEPVESR